MTENKRTRPEGAGRRAGTPNKATANAREAIADFVNGNAHRLEGWLDRIANGEKETVKIKDKKTGVETEQERWLLRPDPKGAYDCFMSVVEYNIPKLQRTEHTGADGGALQIIIEKHGDTDTPS